MEIQIILLIILIPIIVGFWWALSIQFKNIFSNFYYSIQHLFYDLKRINLIPQLIKNEISIRKHIVTEEKYQRERLPKLKAEMHSLFGGWNSNNARAFSGKPETDGAVWSLAERLNHCDHKMDEYSGRGSLNCYNSFFKQVKRPPMWIKYIIAQIIRE